jgi:hypothetical protein
MLVTKPKIATVFALLTGLVGGGLAWLPSSEAANGPKEAQRAKVLPSLVDTSWDVVSEYDGANTTMPMNGDTKDWRFGTKTACFDEFYSCGHRNFIWYDYQEDRNQDPKWLDLIKDKRVLLGIVKFEAGDRMIWLQGKSVGLDEWKEKKGKLDGRPQGFDLKKSNATLLVILKQRSGIHWPP